MKSKIALAMALAFGATAALATGGTTPPKPVPPPQQKQKQFQGQEQTQVLSNQNYLDARTAATSDVDVGVSALSMGSGGAGGSVEIQGPRASQAPDVISYPTAPCRIAVGGSAGWFTGNFGLMGSTEDEGCTLRENSRMLHNLGQQNAAVQIMCLDDRARQALEATGTKCLVSKPTQEAIKP